MKILPLAAELNSILAKEAPPTFEMLFDPGHRLCLPGGIISQSAEAKARAHKFNATIGTATEGGASMPLASLQKHFHPDPADEKPPPQSSGRGDARQGGETMRRITMAFPFLALVGGSGALPGGSPTFHRGASHVALLTKRGSLP